jgi:hypothetical protein
MAATKTLDHDAAKQAKQKKILIVLSIVLVAVLAIQLPRIMGGGGATAATPATDAAATTDGTTTVADPNAAVPGTAVTTEAAPAAPATLTNAVTPVASETQLASFSLFETKDPFVPQIEVEPVPGTSTTAGGTGSTTTKTGDKTAVDKGGAVVGGSAAAGGGTTAEPTLAYATISVGGEPESVGLKDTFPKDEPMFVLASLKERSARIGIAGGSLAKGETVKLVMGKKLTLVNTATGARYTLQLLYTGASPEQTAAFTPEDAAADDAAATTEPAAP